MPIGSGIVYNTGDLILSQVSSSGTAFLETKIAAATSSLIYFDSTARINSASLNSITVGTASYVSGSTSIITNLTASNISASGTGSFGMVGIGTTLPSAKLDVVGSAAISSTLTVTGTTALNGAVNLSLAGTPTVTLGASTTYGVLTATGTNAASIYLNGATRTGFEAKLQFGAAEHQWFNGSLSSQIMTLNTNGLGIGTTSPTNTLSLGDVGSIGQDINTMYVGSNFTGVGVNYRKTGNFALRQHFDSALGIIRFDNAVIGTSGSAISFNERMRIDSSGNVGIGTTSATTKLHVSGSVTALDGRFISNVTSGTDKYFLDCYGTSTNQIFALYENSNTAYLNSYSSMAFRANQNGGSGGYFVFTGANVGIGTTIPGALLHVYGATPTIRVQGSSAASAKVDLVGTYTTWSLENQYVNGANNDMFRIYNSALSADAITINRATNNVGIGATNPAYLLDVSGSSRHGYRTADNHYFTGSVNISGSLNATASWAQNVVSASYALTSSFATRAQTANALNASNTYSIAGLTSAYVDVDGSSAPTTGIYRPSTKTLGLSADGTLIFKISNVSSPATSSIETGNFLVSGSVGIGTTSPAYTLQVGTGANSATARAAFLGGYTVFENSAGTGNPSITFNNDTDTGILNPAANTIVFTTNGSEKVRIDSNGNVGIGTTTVSTKLAVEGGSIATVNTTGSDVKFAFDIRTLVGGAIGFNNAAASNVYGAVTGSAYFGVAQSYPIVFTTAGAERMRLDSTGGINIGTPSQLNSSRVSIADSAVKTSAGNCLTFATATGGSNDFQLIISRGSSTSGYYAFQAVEQGVGYKNIVFNQDGGNVGIGVTSPVAKLQVAGNISGSSFTSSISNAVGFLGTSSWAQNVVSASFATTAQTANALNTGNSYTVGSLTSTTQIGGTTGTIQSLVTPGIYSNGLGTGNAIAISSNTTFANQGAWANLGLHQTTANANDLTAKVYLAVGGWYQNSGTGIPVYIGGGYTSNSSSVLSVVPSDASGNGNVGIGTTVPVAKLQVAGNISGSSFTSSISNAVGFLGTSSWSQNVVSASFATTAQTANALNTANSYTISGLTNNSTLSQQGTLSMGSGYQILATTGTAPIPGISFVGDTNTGIYAPSADTLGFSISGSERVRIDSSGNLLIGTTTSPSNTGLSVGATGTVSQILGGMQNTSWRIRERDVIDALAITTNINDAGTQDSSARSSWKLRMGWGNGQDNFVIARSPVASNSFSDLFYIKSDGNVGISTTSPVSKLTIQGDINVNHNSTSSNYVYRSFTTGHAAGNRGAILRFGIDDGGFSGMSVENIASSNPSYNSQFIDFKTHEGGVSVDTRMRITPLGDVGIGTTVPVAKLQVAGNISGSSFTSSISNAVGFLGTSSWAQNVVSASFATTAQTANALNASNTYSIAGLTSAYVDVNGSATTPSTGIYRPSSKTLGLSADSTLILKINGSVSPYVTSIESGNVGIGSSNPTSKFEVLTSAVGLANQPNIIGNFRGDTDGRSLIRVDNTSTSAGAAALQAGISFVAYSNVSSQPSANKHEAQIILGSTGANSVTGGQTGTLQIVAPQDIAFNVSASNTIMTGSNYTAFGYNAMYIARSGNIGIGTTVPGALLEVSSSTAASLLNVKGAGGNAILFVSGSGNVGIGTTSVPTRLTSYVGSGVISGTNDAIRLQVASYNDAARNTIVWAQDSSNLVLARYGLEWNTSTSQMNFVWRDMYNGGVGSTELMRFTAAGNLGIGTAAPAAKLEITGSSNSALLNIKSPISGAILYVSGSGAVGIGTSNVGAFTLQVSGSFGATTKSFIIDHPTKAGKKLMYGSLESPYHGIRLTGRDTLVNGKCKVELPDYIYKLILHDSVNIQLTGIKCNKTLYVDDINIPENYFTIAYDKAIFESYKDYDFFWDFTAIRADVPELTTEL